MALLQLAEALDAIPYGIELSEDRAEVLKTLLGDEALAPADWLRCAMSPRSMSLAWSNPPFDSDSDGRVELQFARKVVGTLVPGGVMAFVAPQDVCEQHETVQFFEEHFADISAIPFPAEVRRYSEMVLLGKRRAEPNPRYVSSYDWLADKLEADFTYTLPPGQRPRVWKKTEPTDTELVRLVAQSPLRFMLSPVAEKQHALARPPLSLGAGHRALLLSSGYVDGLLEPPGEPPHVVRGSASKVKYVSEQSETEDGKGGTSTRTVTSERS
jgi:hypothetical protein